jgi:hypothetical protein
MPTDDPGGTARRIKKCATVVDGRIATCFAIRNPEKLARVQLS